MTSEVLLSSGFVRQFRRLPPETQGRIRKGLEALVENPTTPRPKADIKRLAGSQPPKYRLRIGAYRIVYAVGSGVVHVLEVFGRGRGYRLD